MKESLNHIDVHTYHLGRAATFHNLVTAHFGAMRLLEKFGLVKQRHEPRDKKRQAWGSLAGKERSFRNIAEHSLVVAMIVDVVTERLEAKGIINREENEQAVTAACLHDLTKRQELQIQHGIKIPRSTFFNPHRRKKFITRLLDRLQISEKDRKILGLTEYTGDGLFFTYLQRGEKIEINESPEELTKWLICLADYMVAHTNLVSPEERIKEAKQRNQYSELEKWWFERLYGKQELEEILEGPYGAQQINDRLAGIALGYLEQVETQLKELLDIPQEGSLMDFVQQQIYARYEANVSDQ